MLIRAYKRPKPCLVLGKVNIHPWIYKLTEKITGSTYLLKRHMFNSLLMKTYFVCLKRISPVMKGYVFVI